MISVEAGVPPPRARGTPDRRILLPSQVEQELVSTMFSRSILLGLALAAGADAFMTPSPMLARTGVRSAAVASPQLRAGSLAASTRGRQGVSLFMAASAEHMEQLKGCKQALWDLVDKTNANPIMVRLAWHDAGTYDVNIKDWPKCGGAIGSIRFDPEITHGANAGVYPIHFRDKIGAMKPAMHPYAWD